LEHESVRYQIAVPLRRDGLAEGPKRDEARLSARRVGLELDESVARPFRLREEQAADQNRLSRRQWQGRVSIEIVGAKNAAPAPLLALQLPPDVVESSPLSFALESIQNEVEPATRIESRGHVLQQEREFIGVAAAPGYSRDQNQAIADVAYGAISRRLDGQQTRHRIFEVNVAM